jgi:hypothetical protein
MLDSYSQQRPSTNPALNFMAVVQKAATLVDLCSSFDYAFEKTVDGYPKDDSTTLSAIGLAAAEGSCLKALSR